MNEVVITGVGLVTPIGVGADATWESLMSGHSGAGPLTAFDASGLPVQIACQANDFQPEEFINPRELKRTDRFTHMALAASALALKEAGWDELPYDEDRVGVIIGTGIGGIDTIEHEHRSMLNGGPRRVSPFMVPKLMPNGAASAVSMTHHLRGPSFAPTSACASGAHSVGEAARILRYGAADAMLAGGTEAALTPLSVSAFARMGALSTRNNDPEHASRPFDKGRDGFVFGEGAGVLVLETRSSAERRGAPILAVLAGYGATADAFHVTQPDPEGRGASQAMIAALDDAKIDPSDVDYVNAHGTSTPHNDRIETLAIKKALGNEAKRVPISSTKSQTGHLLGAAGAVEAAVSALAVAKGVIPATRNLTESDPDCDLDYVPGDPREEEVKVVVSNSFGFGGQNGCLVVTAP